MTDLGVLKGYVLSQATGVNDAGQVVGFLGPPELTGDHAFLYSNGAMTDLGGFLGQKDSSTASGINDSGQVVGWSSVGNAVDHAFLYSKGKWTDLGTMPGDT
jgi:probable HAF family extracellular repeat protein